jgi:hypothetical protein
LKTEHTGEKEILLDPVPRKLNIRRLKYISCSDAMNESDIGRHAKTACGLVRAIRKSDGIKGSERQYLARKQPVADCFAIT